MKKFINILFLYILILTPLKTFAGLDKSLTLPQITAKIKNKEITDPDDFKSAFDRAKEGLTQSNGSIKMSACELLSSLNEIGYFKTETLDIAKQINIESPQNIDTIVKTNLLRGLIKSGYGLEYAKETAANLAHPQKSVFYLIWGMILYSDLVAKGECYKEAVDAVNLANSTLKDHLKTGKSAIILKNTKFDLLSSLVNQGIGYDLAYKNVTQDPGWELESWANKAKCINVLRALIEKKQRYSEINAIFKMAFKSIGNLLTIPTNLEIDAMNVTKELSVLLIAFLENDPGSKLLEYLKENFLSNKADDIKNASAIYEHLLIDFLKKPAGMAHSLFENIETKTIEQRKFFATKLYNEISNWLLKQKLNKLTTPMQALKTMLETLGNKMVNLSTRLK